MEGRIMPRYYVVRTYTKVSDFVERGVSAIGWSDFDLAHEKTESVIKVLDERYKNGEISSRQRGKWIGQIRLFQGIKEKDVVLVPCYKGFYIGIATGKFKYDEKLARSDIDLANQIELCFIKEHNKPIVFARDGKLNSLSKKLGVPGFTVLEFKKNDSKAIEQIEMLIAAGKDISPEDRVYEIEKQHLDEFRTALQKAFSNDDESFLNAKGRGFEEMIANMLTQDGYVTKLLSKQVGGSSIADADILAIKKSSLGEEFDTAYCIQAKHYQGSSSNGFEQILEFKKQLEKNNQNGTVYIDRTSLKLNQIKYMLVSSGSFTPEIEDKAIENNIILINGERLADLLFHVIDDMPELRHKLGFVKTYQRFDVNRIN